MEQSTLAIPSDLLVAAGITPEEARIALARVLFQDGRLSRDRARDLSGDAERFEASLFREADQLDLNNFLDWASHDLKTPLNMVIGFSKVVLRGIDGPINETQQTDLTSVHNNGQRLLSLISMLVDIARLNKGGIHLSLADVDFAELLSESAARWREQNPTRILESHIELESGALRVDAGHMRQLVAGTLTYCVLQVGEGGTVHLATADQTDRVIILVESHGSRDRAMPELDLAMLRFINRSLARLHGGDLAESDNPEGGVRVRFWLPK
jgi:signal transduction histidine kinase